MRQAKDIDDGISLYVHCYNTVLTFLLRRNIITQKEGWSMANTNVTMRMDATLKAQLQELMSNLGIDITTFFTMAAKQAVREQALPFHPNMNSGIYGAQAYRLAMQNTKYDRSGRAIISAKDEWADEDEWDDLFQQMSKERGA